MDYIKTQSHGVFNFSVSSENLKISSPCLCASVFKKNNEKIRQTFGGTENNAYLCPQKQGFFTITISITTGLILIHSSEKEEKNKK